MKFPDFFKIFFTICRILAKVRKTDFQKEENNGCRILPKTLSHSRIPASRERVYPIRGSAPHKPKHKTSHPQNRAMIQIRSPSQRGRKGRRKPYRRPSPHPNRIPCHKCSQTFIRISAAKNRLGGVLHRQVKQYAPALPHFRLPGRVS